MKSILNTEKGTCFLCGYKGYTEEHHIFYGRANRKLSEKHGLKVFLCTDCHRTGKEAIHNSCKETKDKLHIIGQTAFEMQHGSRTDFIKEFGKNHI